MKNFKNFGSKILFFAIFFVFEAFSQNLLFQLDLTDTTKMTFGDYTWKGYRKISQIEGSGTYAPIYYQPDTSMQPVWRKGEGVFFEQSKLQHFKILSGQKNFPSTATFIFVIRHLGRNPSTYPAYIIGDTASFVGYDDRTKGLRVYSTSGGYLDRRCDDYLGLKNILEFKVKSNYIDTLFINGYDYDYYNVTLGNSLKAGWIGRYDNGRYWSGFIYEILVYDQALTNKQLDSINAILSEKHHIGYKIIDPDPVPHSTQPLTGSGTQADPYLIYTAWHLDSLRFIYPKNINTPVYVKLMADIDLSNHTSLTIDTLNICLDGNHKTMKNLARYGGKPNERHALFYPVTTSNTNISVKNLIIENFTILSDAGLYGNGIVSFLYANNISYSNILADSILIKKSFIRAVSWATVSNTVNTQPIGRMSISSKAKRIGLISTEIILDSKSFNSKFFEGGTINELFFDKNSVIGAYFTNGSGITTFMFNGVDQTPTDIYFRNKFFSSNYNSDEESVASNILASGIKINIYIRVVNSYFNMNPIYVYSTSAYQTVSFDYWDNVAANLSTTYIDTTYKRNFLSYPTSAYSGLLPNVKTTSEMKLQSTYVGWDFDSVWAISPEINDGYPYLQFSSAGAILNVLYPNDSTITKLTRDTLNIKFQSSLDTTSVYLVNINNNDTIYIGKTINDSILTTLPPKMQGQFKVLITSTDKQDYFLAPNFFTVIRDTNIIIYQPYLYQTVYKGDSLSVIYSQDIDTAKFYIRKDRYSNWEYKGFEVVTDTLDTFKIFISYDYSDDAQVLVTNFDSTVTGISDAFIVLSNRYIDIVEPTPDSITIYSNGLLVKVKSKNVPDYDVYVKIDSNYYYYTNITTANSGNEDYTSFMLDYKKYLLSGKITIIARKGDIGEIKGSMDTAYYKQNQFTYAGMRSPYPQFQSKTNFSKLYELSGNIYSICYYAYPFGWYDYWDRVEIYKYNPISQFFNLVASRGFPNSAPYPMFLFYRTGIYSAALVGYSQNSSYFYTINYYLMPDTIYQISPLVNINQMNPAPINIDANRTTEVVANLWKYRIEGTKIYAYDLKNAGNNLMLADLTNISSYLTGIKPNAFELFAGAGKLFITNHCYTDQNSKSDTYFVNLFPENEILTNDEVTVEIKTAKRNFFRGIYPKAIIKVIPRL